MRSLYVSLFPPRVMLCFWKSSFSTKIEKSRDANSKFIIASLAAVMSPSLRTTVIFDAAVAARLELIAFLFDLCFASRSLIHANASSFTAG